MDQAHNIFELAAAFLLPIGFLTLAWLTNRRTPWLATVGGALCLLGFLPLSLYVGQDSLYYDVARAGFPPQVVDLVVRWNRDGIMSFYGIWFGLGSVLGPTVLGVALWRSRQVPVWAAIFLILSRLPVFVFGLVPFHTAVAIVIAGVVLMVAAAVPAARAVMTAQHKQAQAAALRSADQRPQQAPTVPE
jgi:MFS family permease